MLDEVNKIISNASLNFNAKAIGLVFMPAGYMCAWALNIVTFNKIFKDVKPLVESQKRAQEDLDAKTKALNEVKEKVRKLDEQCRNSKESWRRPKLLSRRSRTRRICARIN